MKVLLVVLLLLGSVFSQEEDEEDYGVYKEAINFVQSCGIHGLTLCLKEKALKYIDNLPGDIDLGSGLKIKHNSEGYVPSKHSAVLPDEAQARELALNDVLMDRISDYVRSHTIEFKMPQLMLKDDNEEVAEARKKKGGGGGKKGLMYLLYLKAAMLGAIALKVIALAAFKALLVSKIALTIASVIALKKLTDQKHHSTTYEVVAHPYDDHSHYGHYDRSFSQNLAYKNSEGTRSLE